MRKIVVICISVLLFFCFSPNLTTSTGIKISPAKSLLEMRQGEINCTTIWIYPDNKITIRDRWSINGSGDISKYNLHSGDLGIKLYFNKTHSGEYLVCFESSNAGRFYGALLFSQENSTAGIGTWVDLNVVGITYHEIFSSITANAIKNVGEKVDLGLTVIFILLFIVFILLVRRLF